MKNHQVVLERHGGPAVLHLAETDLPTPKPGEVRVRVVAIGVAYTDILIREGLYPGIPKPPFAPGYDIVGVVDELGAGEISLRVGQPVAALTVTGGYSEYLCLPASDIVPVPESVDYSEAAALVLHYVTAYQMLHRVAKVEAGDRILVHGAAGGVGMALLQLAQLTGVEAYGTASASKHDAVRAMGAVPIDYHHVDFVQRILELTQTGVDAVFDLVGGAHLFRSYQVLRPQGHLVNFGFMAAAQARHGRQLKLLYNFLCLGLLKLQMTNRKQVSFYSITALKQQQPDWFCQDLSTLLNLLAEGKIHPVIAKRLSLKQARQAQELLEKSAVSGSLVLLCDKPA